jgi:hypothetical protein
MNIELGEEVWLEDGHALVIGGIDAQVGIHRAIREQGDGISAAACIIEAGIEASEPTITARVGNPSTVRR